MTQPANQQIQPNRTSGLLSELGETPVLECELDIDVRRFRAVVGSLLLAGLLVGSMLPFAHDGVQITSFQSHEVDAAEQKRLLDKYNSISGSLTVLLMKPIDTFLTMVIAVVSLSITTKFNVDREQRCRLFTMGVVGAVSYLMNIGFSALNMQVIPGKVHSILYSSELNAIHNTEPNATYPLLNSWDTKFRESEPANSVRNTILRNLFVTTEDIPTWCNRTDYYPLPFKNLIASYGFPALSWQQQALSEAVEPTASVTMPMNTNSGELQHHEDLPMDRSIATNLAVYALVLSNTFLGWWGAHDEAWGMYSPGYVSNDYPDSLVMADYFNLTKPSSDNATFVRNIHEVLVDYFKKAENASTDDEHAKIELSHVDVGDTVIFDALTIEVPTKPFGEQEDNSSTSNPFYKTLYTYGCSLGACLGDE
ncbi:unnamed protein product [Phytophthora fragariaefolia]|uniref:Unnamed protein product n=1 Tax=Phytophthora fragariaefolia TaxID=1490495 RepID=A0A9W6TNL8_9STRA|nr:unnamed protein product [Phytophthora fragariaefolia]